MSPTWRVLVVQLRNLGLCLSLLLLAGRAEGATLLGTATVSWSGGNSDVSYLEVTTLANELGSTADWPATDCVNPMIACEGIPGAIVVPRAVVTYDATQCPN